MSLYVLAQSSRGSDSSDELGDSEADDSALGELEELN